MVQVLNSFSRAKFAAIAAGALGLAAAMPAAAADSVTVTVNATIIGVCKFFTAAPVLDIRNTGTSGSNIDPSSSTTATGTVPIEYRCSNGTTPIFTVPTSVTLNSGSNSMVATISSSNSGAGTGMGSGQAKTLTVNGSILQAGFQDKPVGAYTNTMVVSVLP